MERRQQIIEGIRTRLPFGTDSEIELREDSALADVGLNSLHLITVLLELQREYRLGDDWWTQGGMPNTVGELVNLVERGLSQQTHAVSGA